MTGVPDRAGGGGPLARLLAELEADCSLCGGTGTTPNERWLEWHRRAGELVAVAQAARRAHELRPAPAPAAVAPVTAPDRVAGAEPAIVAAVERAIDDHMQARPSEPEEDRCAACQGLGRELTAAGRQFAELLARHGFVRRP
ncbi:hypothetical protein E1293_06415 [Actinomadura darangshiensis]|uniref:Uncharacterized protein n=1 Tax=Actinomadura darangshiensis TaxID=705336 RepID=A0A4R5BW57_9ACTN|nr:hypothetical protein [Actinomadura darangshiensis]TDD88512.1 hypothetical protein E1293_06415 [Actinomadura darangshiensis]